MSLGADATGAVLVALVGTAGLLMVALIPLLLGQRALKNQGEKTYEHLNSVESEVLGADGPHPTLGQTIQSIRRELGNVKNSAEEHYERNAVQHEELHRQVSEVGEALIAHIQTENPAIERMMEVIAPPPGTQRRRKTDPKD